MSTRMSSSTILTKRKAVLVNMWNLRVTLQLDDVMDDIIDQLFAEVNRVYQEHSTLTNEVLSALNFTLQAPLAGALDLVDHCKVSRLVSPSGRQVFQVIGSSGNPYILLPSSDYCGCLAYKFSVLKKGEHKMCKHGIAVRLSEAMGITQKFEIPDQEMTSLISNID